MLKINMEVGFNNKKIKIKRKGRKESKESKESKEKALRKQPYFHPFQGFKAFSHCVGNFAYK